MNSAAKHRIQTISFSLFTSIGWASVLVPTLILAIEKTYAQSDTALGALFGVSALSGAVGSFLCGLATERFGRRLTTPVVAFMLAAGLIGQAVAPGWTAFFAAAIVANLAAGALDGDINGLFLDLHADGKTGGALNLLHVFFSTGAVSGAFLIGFLTTLGLSWQTTVLASGIIVTLLAIATISMPLPSGKRATGASTPTGQPTPKEHSLVPFAALAVAICLYVGAELGVTSWVVKYVAQTNTAAASAALAVFWAGITLGRILSIRIADRFNAAGFTIGCFLLSSATLIGALLVPNVTADLTLYGLTGVLFGPIFPMIMVIGGKLYPHRLSVLSGSLGAASTVGAIAYPALIGFTSATFGLRAGLLSAAALGLVAAWLITAAVNYRTPEQPKLADAM